MNFGSNVRITSEILHLSIRTVEMHRSDLLAKLGNTNMVEAAFRAAKVWAP